MDILMLSLARAGGIPLSHHDLARHAAEQQRILPARKAQRGSFFRAVGRFLAAGLARGAKPRAEKVPQGPALKPQEV